MKIKSISVRNLHGVINQEVRFNEDLTILVGINGCGKTSILNALDWMLKPNFAKLAITEYDSLKLDFSCENIEYQIVATKTKEKVIIELSANGSAYAPIEILLVHKQYEDTVEAEELYASLGPEEHELPAWNKLKSFIKPNTITLDRAIATDVDDEQLYETARGLIIRKKQPKNPIDIVMEVAASKYSEYRADAAKNDSELKAELLLSIFQEHFFSNDSDKKPKPVTGDEITRLESKVTTYLSETIKSDKMKETVHNFFSDSRRFSQRISREKAASNFPQSFLYGILLSRHKKIENIARAFSQFEQRNRDAFLSLRKYLAAVNKFVNDSKKEIYFDERSGKLFFRVMSHEPSRGVGRAVTKLSSGERQILILFTFIAFKSSDNGVFVVDEPELSLHPKWQYDFMDTFFSLRPEGTQVIIATHSPDIVGNYKNNCIILRSDEQ